MSEALQLESSLLRVERDAWRDRALAFERALTGAAMVLRDMTVGAPIERAEGEAERAEACLAAHSHPIDCKIAEKLAALPLEAWGDGGVPARVMDGSENLCREPEPPRMYGLNTRFYVGLGPDGREVKAGDPDFETVLPQNTSPKAVPR